MWRTSRMQTNGSPAALHRRALLALLGLMFLLLVPLPRPVEPNPLMEDLKNLLHVPLFMAVTLLLRVLQPPAARHRGPVWACAVAAGVLGVLSEVVQGLTGRTPAVGDLVADLAGILLACAVLLRGTALRVGITRWVLLMAGGGMFALTAVPLVVGISTFTVKRKAFPVLMAQGIPGALWQEQGNTRLQVAGAEPGGLVVRMPRGDYEGLRYVVPRGVGTQGYSGLVIETANEGEAFELGIRIDVTHGTRKNAAVMVPPGNAVMKVSWTRETGDGELRRVVLFTGVDQPARKFSLLDVRLTRDAE